MSDLVGALGNIYKYCDNLLEQCFGVGYSVIGRYVRIVFSFASDLDLSCGWQRRLIVGAFSALR